ncbi:hypothetical protein CDI09_06210 [Komagataeibacter nataicola]|uniref:Uncharacterized protein n=1 Tax=Komagataeibacter nataicola TaxID=265960 RepID=A0ABX5PBX7_9PROT|nr:hypothetical protein CDI09_06210 [Komagataeibacter nataicola]
MRGKGMNDPFKQDHHIYVSFHTGYEELRKMEHLEAVWPTSARLLAKSHPRWFPEPAPGK